MKAEWHLLQGGLKITEDFLDESWEHRVPIRYWSSKDLDLWDWLDARGVIFQDYRVCGARHRDGKIPFKARYNEVMAHWVEFHDPDLAMLFKLTFAA